MSWRIRVRHASGYRYSSPVGSSYNEARMTPATDATQQTLESRLEVSPPVRALRYRDYWGTVVDAFDVHVPHAELSVVALSVVDTADAPRPGDGVGWPVLADPALRDRFAEYLLPSAFARPEPELAGLVAELSAGRGPLEAGLAAAAWVHDTLRYQKGVTGVRTTSAEARAVGGGVCQDFAHLSIALLRAMGLPARYVSGYLYPDQDARPGDTGTGESHAWVEMWAGGWVPADPTSGSAVGERHVAVARGRDYADVRPLSGIYRGPPAESLGVSVELTRLR